MHINVEGCFVEAENKLTMMVEWKTFFEFDDTSFDEDPQTHWQM